jgi:hypothetical protein
MGRRKKNESTNIDNQENIPVDLEPVEIEKEPAELLIDEEFEKIFNKERTLRKPKIFMSNNPKTSIWRWGGQYGMTPCYLYSRILSVYYDKKICLSRAETMKIYKQDTFKKNRFNHFSLKNFWFAKPIDFYEFLIKKFKEIRNVD